MHRVNYEIELKSTMIIMINQLLVFKSKSICIFSPQGLISGNSFPGPADTLKKIKQYGLQNLFSKSYLALIYGWEWATVNLQSWLPLSLHTKKR